MAKLDLPWFFIVGIRPVKAFHAVDGEVDVVAFDYATGELVRDLSYLSRITVTHAPDIERVSEAEFEAQVLKLRAQLKEPRRF